MSDVANRSKASSKLEAYLQLAEEMCALNEEIAKRSRARVDADQVKPGLRERVMTGLALKIDNSFRALIADVRARRSESMHHMKTMAEAFIYFHSVARDSSTRTAALVLASALDRKVIFFQDNPGYVSHDEVSQWEKARDYLLQECAEHYTKPATLRAELKRVGKIEQMAKNYSPELGSWYSRVYRLACEPAHLGDLLEFMPPGNPIKTGSPPTAELRAYIAVDYGVHLMLAMARAISGAGLHFPTEELEKRLQQIRQA